MIRDSLQDDLFAVISNDDDDDKDGGDDQNSEINFNTNSDR